MSKRLASERLFAESRISDRQLMAARTEIAQFMDFTKRDLNQRIRRHIERECDACANCGAAKTVYHERRDSMTGDMAIRAEAACGNAQRNMMAQEIQCPDGRFLLRDGDMKPLGEMWPDKDGWISDANNLWRDEMNRKYANSLMPAYAPTRTPDQPATVCSDAW